MSIASGRRLGLISQIPVYPEGYTVEDVLKSAFSRMQRMEDEMNALSQQMASGDESEETLRRYGELSAKFEGLGGYDTETPINKVANGLSIPPEMRERLFDTLSGGEKTRVNLGRLILEDTDILLLDEPTNHMDMRSKDILKNAILKYDGTVVVVSHDREFLDGMVEKVYEFRDGGVKEYLGGIYYFLEKRKLESLQEIERRDAPAKMPAKGDEPKPAVSGKLSYEQRKEQEKQLRKAKKVVETIEAELADIEKRIAEYDARFAAATEYNEADYKAYNELKTRYDHQMHEWEKASYELEIVAD